MALASWGYPLVRRLSMPLARCDMMTSVAPRQSVWLSALAFEGFFRSAFGVEERVVVEIWDFFGEASGREWVEAAAAVLKGSGAA